MYAFAEELSKLCLSFPQFMGFITSETVGPSSQKYAPLSCIVVLCWLWLVQVTFRFYANNASNIGLGNVIHL